MPTNQQPLEPAIYRMAVIDRTQVDREQRSIPLVLATEAPVRMYDWQRDAVVNEVLHVGGMDVPKQVPLLDSHDRSTTNNVRGSIREFKKQDGQLVGRAYFAADAESVRLFNNYADGHLTDFSVGAQSRMEDIEYEGNTRHVRKSRLLEGSAVVVGADPNAKALLAQRAYLDPEQVKEEAMFAKVRELMLKRGLKSDATDAECQEFLASQLERADATADETKELAAVIRSLKTTVTATPAPAAPVATATPDANEVLRGERQRITDLNEIFRQNPGDVSDTDRQKWLADGTAADVVAREVLRRKASAGTPTTGRIEGGLSQREKFYAAAQSAMTIRALNGVGLTPNKVTASAEQRGDFDAIRRAASIKEAFEKPALGHERFRFIKLPDLARAFLTEAGENVEGLPDADICSRAIKQRDFVTLRSGDVGSYNVTGSFANLMLDAANKTLLAAFDEAPASYPIWVRTAPSVADFKNINRVRFGELPDPEIVAENAPYPEKTTTDLKESYRVEKYGEIFSISMEAIINDDMNAISRIPMMQGNAMRRKINKVVYEVLTSNPTMSDTGALFNNTAVTTAGGHNNLGSDALSATALDNAFKAMLVQPGLTAGTILNIMPRYLIVPAALSATALQLANSTAVPTAGGSAAGNSNTANLYGPNGPRQLVVVVEGQLDGASGGGATAYFLAADSAQIDTVELTFLQGFETPRLTSEEGFKTDGVNYKIAQVFAAKAIDWRGLRKGNS
jgi:hypothetical protein